MKTPAADSSEFSCSQVSPLLLWIHDTADRLHTLLRDSAFFMDVEWTQPSGTDWSRTIAVIPADKVVPPGAAAVIRYGAASAFARAEILGMQDFLHSNCTADELEFRVRRQVPAELPVQSAQLMLHDNVVLSVLRQNRGLPVERSVLLQLLGAPEHSRCVDMTISRLRSRLVCSAEWIRTVRGVGYMLETVVDNL